MSVTKNVWSKIPCLLSELWIPDCSETPSMCFELNFLQILNILLHSTIYLPQNSQNVPKLLCYCTTLHLQTSLNISSISSDNLDFHLTVCLVVDVYPSLTEMSYYRFVMLLLWPAYSMQLLSPQLFIWIVFGVILGNNFVYFKNTNRYVWIKQNTEYASLSHFLENYFLQP